MDPTFSFLSSWLQSGAIMTYRPDSVLLGWGEKTTCATEESTEMPSFFLSDFFLTEKQPFTRFAFHRVISVEELLDGLETFSTESRRAPVWQKPEREPFRTAFAELQTLFSKNSLQKAVPYAVTKAATSMSLPQLVHSLRNSLRYLSLHKGYLYGIWDHHEGILGLSPEILFHKSDPYTLKTMAVAGTALSTDPDEAFLGDPKQREEHRWVIQGIVEALEPYGRLKVEETRVESFGMLAHLVTPIHVALRNPLPFEQIVRSLHPTPALGAYPKDEGRHWLERADKRKPRGSYGAPVGWVSAGGEEAITYVAIRNVMWSREEMAIFAGCGIVRESDEEREWKEVQRKIASIKRIFSLTTSD